MNVNHLQGLWFRHRNQVLRIAIALLAVAATFRLLNEFLRLIYWDPLIKGANDLRNFQNAMKGLFAGQPIYRELVTSPYPPASYAIFWPFLGWLDLAHARWFWAITVVAVLAWLTLLVVQQSKAESRQERILAALMLLSMNGAGVTIGNGQLGLHILAALLTALVLIQDKPVSIHQQIFVSFLLLFSLGKPTLSVPFLWIVMFAPNGKRILFMTAAGYVALSWFAVSFQREPAVDVFQSWLTRASLVAMENSYANVHWLLGSLQMQRWIVLASLTLFGLLGLWIYFHRNVDRWLLIAVAAFVARFWTYHRYYDDLLILLPMICLFRIAKSSRHRIAENMIAGCLLAMISFLNLARLHNISTLRFQLITSANLISWSMTLLFLLYLARREKRERIFEDSGTGELRSH